MAHVDVEYHDRPIKSVVLEMTGDEAQALTNLLAHVRLGAADVGDYFFNLNIALENAGLDEDGLLDVVLTENGIELVER